MLEVTRVNAPALCPAHTPGTQGVRDTTFKAGASVQRVRTIESTDFVGNRRRGRRARAPIESPASVVYQRF